MQPAEFIRKLGSANPQELPSIYIFVGPNKFTFALKEQGLKYLGATILQDKKVLDADSISDYIEIKRFGTHDYKESDFWNEVYAVPFLNKPRLVILNLGEKTDFINKISQSLEEYLSKRSFFTKVVILADKWEGYSLFLGKLVRQKAWVIEYLVPSERRLPDWVISELARYNKKIGQRDARLLTEKTGNNLSELSSNIHKLVLLHKGSQYITADSVRNFIDIQRNYDIKELAESIVNKQPAQSLVIANQLLRKGESVNKIIGYLRSFLRQDYRFQDDKDVIAKLLKTDLSIKTSLLSEDLALQLLVIKLSQ
jgi:DNA polymerase III delta subunit